MSQQIQITGGAKVRNLEGVLTGTAGVVNALGINVPSGIPQLDGSGKILVSQLPNSVMEYKGTWNAATNTPTLANGTGNQGDVYLCSTAGTVNFGAGAITFAVGDQVIYSGTIWQKAGGATGTVTSVAVTESGDALTITGSPITTSGTINIGFAGTTGQYVNGAGGLTTFPSLTGYVPYTGATSNVALGEFGLSGGYIGLDTTPTSTPTSVGTLSWDTTYKTPKVITGTGNTTLQIGQEEVILIHNGTGSALTDGQVVYVTGSTGDLPSVSLADASSETTSAATLGVVTEPIANGSNGFVTVSGMVNGLNTLAYNEGDLLWLSETAGAFTNVKPISPAHLVLIGYVIKKAGGNGSILVKIQNTQELEECSDVLFTSLANNNILAYESSTDLWKNKTIAAVLGYTPQAQLTLTTTGTSGAATLTGATLNIPNYTTDLSGYVPYSGATGTININNQSLTNCGFITSNGFSNADIALRVKNTTSGTFYTQTGYLSIHSSANYFAFHNSASQYAIFNYGGGNSYTLPSSTGTLALTSDIPSLSGYIQGSGTTNYIPKFTASGTIGDSAIVDNASYVDVRKSFQVSSSEGTGALMTISSNAYDTVSFRAVNSSGGNKELLYFGSTVSFWTGPLDVNSTTERMTITPAGNVGIGTTSPSFAAGTGLAISDASRSNLSLNDGTNALNIFQTGADAYFNMYSSGNIIFRTTTNNTERMRITSGGAVGIGTSSIANGTTFGGGNQVNRLKVASGSYTCLEINGNTSGGSIQFTYGTDLPNQVAGLIGYNYASGAANEMWVSNALNGILGFGTNNTERMRITSAGNVGIGTTSPSYKLSIQGPSGGTALSWTDAINNTGYLSIRSASAAIGADNNLLFETAGAERMRITSGGNVCIGTTTGSGALNVQYDGNTFNAITTRPINSYSAAAINFLNISGTSVGYILPTSVSTAYVTTSDYRLKQDLKTYNGLNLINSIKTYDYEWKIDNSRSYGVLAHELQEIVPNAVYGEKDGEQMQGVDYSKLVPILIKSIQELEARIKQLENK